MKRILAISLSLAMVFALFGAMTVSVSAEDVEWSVFKSADNGDLPTKAHKSNSISSITNTFNTIDSNKIWQVTQSGYMKAGSYFTFSAGALKDVTDIRLWAAAPKGGFDLILKAGNTIYGYNNSLTSTGKTYSFGSANFNVYNSTKIDVGVYTEPTSTNVAFSEIDMSAVTMIQIQRRYDDTIGAKTGTMYYDRIEIAKPAATSPVTEITMESGAAMRIDGTTNGIRFEASVDKSAFVAIKDKTKIEIGTLIAKEGTEKSKVVVENAVDTGTGAQKLTGDQIPVAKYASTTTMADIEGTDKYVIYGSLVGIDDGNATQKYVARAYVKYTDESGEHVLYAKDLSEPRSLAEVAYKLKNDTAVPEGMSNTYYNSLCQTHKDYVDGLAIQYVE